MTYVIKNETKQPFLKFKIRIQEIYESEPVLVEHSYFWDMEGSEMIPIDQKVVITIMDGD